MKKWISLCCVISLLIACLAACTTKKEPENPISTYISVQKHEEKLAIIFNDVMIVTEYAYDYDHKLSISRDGDHALCETSDGVLLYIHDAAAEKLTEHVYAYRMNAAGTTVVYQESEGGSLQVYQKTTGETKTIGNGYIRDCALSPNGQTLAYLATSSEWESDRHLYVYKDGKEIRQQKLPSWENWELISINDQADLLYLLSGDKVISMDGEGKTSLVRTNVTEERFFSNADHTQLLFYSNGVGTCLSTKGQVSVTLAEQWLWPIEPTGVHFVTNGAAADRLSFVDGVLQTTCHVPDLFGQLLGERKTYFGGIGYDFWLPNAEGVYTLIAESEPYANRQSSYYMDPQGRFLYYTETDEKSMGVYYVNLETGDEPILLVEKMSNFAVCRDGTGVFSIYDGLYFHSTAEDDQPQRLLDTDSVAYCYISENNRVYISRFVGTNYCLFVLNEEGTKAELLLENVDRVVQEDCGMIYIRADEADYVIRNGELIRLRIQYLEA